MSKQEINIQNNTGTINIYNNSEQEDVQQKKISMAAVDKYSSPLTASIMLSPWGEKLHRVSFLLRNDLIGQVLQRNYIVFDTKKLAEDFFEKLEKDMNVFKKQAETDRRHNVFIVADIWNLMQKYEKELSVVNSPESKDLTVRTEVPEIHEYFQGAKPYGLVFHDLDKHFPDHSGIVKSASKKYEWNYEIENVNEYRVDVLSEIKTVNSILCENAESLIKISKKMEENIDYDLLKKIAKFCISNNLDEKKVKNSKTKILLALKSVFLYSEEDKIKNWIKSNNSIFNKISKELDSISEEYVSKRYRKISQDDYDTFIFDADKTLWDGVPAYKLNPPLTIEEDVVTDVDGKKITLKDGVRDMLAGLYDKRKRIGLVSHSEKDGVDFQDQPVIKLLKLFDILKYFNEMVVVAKVLPKSIFIPNENRILFIDDDLDNLIDVVKNTEADGALAENVIYYPKDIKESIKRTGLVKVSNNLKYQEDFIPLLVVAEPTEFFKRKDEKYWEEKEKEILDQFWYSSESIKKEDYNKFLSDISSKGIESNSLLESIFDANENRIISSPISVLIKLTDSGKEKLSPLSFIEAKRKRIPVDQIPEKPKGNRKYELDHRVPLHKGGEDKKNNLQWVEKNKHKQKTKEEGSYEYGGKDRHKKLKNKGSEEYSKYQSDTGKAKIEKERAELGEKAFSEKQRERAKKRWKKSSRLQWYKISEKHNSFFPELLLKESNIRENTDIESAMKFVSIFNILTEKYGMDDGFEIFDFLSKKERENADHVREKIKSLPNNENILLKFKDYIRKNVVDPVFDFVNKIVKEDPDSIYKEEVKQKLIEIFEKSNSFFEHNRLDGE